MPKKSKKSDVQDIIKEHDTFLKELLDTCEYLAYLVSLNWGYLYTNTEGKNFESDEQRDNQLEIWYHAINAMLATISTNLTVAQLSLSPAMDKDSEFTPEAKKMMADGISNTGFFDRNLQLSFISTGPYRNVLLMDLLHAMVVMVKNLITEAGEKHPNELRIYLKTLYESGVFKPDVSPESMNEIFPKVRKEDLN